MKFARVLKKSCILVACILMCMMMLAGCAKATGNTSTSPAKASEATSETGAGAATETASEESAASSKESVANTDVKDHYLIQIDIEDYGTIKVDLDRTAAPITVDNFVKLVKAGFYDGTTFHRIIKGFMMQGGDPTGTGYGGLQETIKGEFASNGVDNPLLHTRGAISMARSKDPNSASCQFFIMHQDYPSLDGEYACFGYVTEGIEVVDEICENAKVVDNNGSVAPENQPKITKITLIEE